MITRQLSSKWTAFFQRFFMPFWIIGMGIGAILLIVSPDEFGGEDLAPSTVEFLTVWILISSLLYYWFGRLVTVRLVGSDLEIRRYSLSATVPLTNVLSVTATRFLSPEPMTLHFLTDTPFGLNVTFLPPARIFRFFTLHPLKTELEALIEETRAGTGQSN